MAEQSQIAGLFMTPEQYQQTQDNAAYERAAALAQLDPFQAAKTSIGYGAYQLGGAIGGALGGQDPMLQRITARNQLMNNINWSDPKSVQAGIDAAMQNKDSQAALAIRDKFLEQQKTLAETAAKLRERPANEPELIKLQNSREALAAQFGESDPRVKQIDNAIAKMTRQGKTLEETMGAGLGAIAAAMAGAQAKKAAEAGGTEVGKKLADIGGKQTALDAITGAKGLVEKGIYSGKYGPMQEGLAGYTGGVIGSQDTLSNTETFRAYLGDVVIPGLKDFGGSDTVEELKYLQSVYAGDTTVQEKTLRNMLNRAESKIKKNITMLQEQQRAISKGEQLPTGPSQVQKATKRFNPTTGKLETIGG